MGIGGAPEGVLAAAALRAIGGQMQARLVFRNDDERGRAQRVGITDFDRKYELTDLARGNVLFVASGVTDGSLLRGVQVRREEAQIDTLLLSSRHQEMRWIRGRRPVAAFEG
jgi:fructose-1,6-bisphosphatase II / sedoheptulose-1,7-bisphosphatase